MIEYTWFKMKKHRKEGIVLKSKKAFIEKWFLAFMIYAIMGWCYEVFLEVVVYRWGFTNRGVLFGPYCPVYGVGALVFMFFYCRFLKARSFGENKFISWIIKIALTFILCMFVATLIELIASYMLELFTGHWMWETYVNYKYNFQGRIALSTSIRFGLGGLFFIFVIQPLIDKLTDRINEKAMNVISLILGIIVLCDMVYTFFIK